MDDFTETLILPMKLINYLKKMMIYLGQMTFCSTKKLSKVQQQSKKIQGLFAFVSPLNKLLSPATRGSIQRFDNDYDVIFMTYKCYIA